MSIALEQIQVFPLWSGPQILSGSGYLPPCHACHYLFHQWVHRAWQVSRAACGAHNRGKTVDGNSVEHPTQNSLVLAGREEALLLCVLQARVHGIFSNRVLAYSFSEQPTGTATVVLGSVDKLKESRVLPRFLSCAFRPGLLRRAY